MNPNRITTLLHCIRLTSLITAIVIVIGSLCLYSSNALPLNITDDGKEDIKTWILQSITDRRLISTLVAAQASIFCPLFVLLNPSSLSSKPTAQITEPISATTSLVEMVCQLLMPLGLALSWMFSILFDLKTTDLIGQGDVCLLEDVGCVLFGFVYGLKYAIVILFAIETSLVILYFIVTRFHSRQIQLPTDEPKK